MEASYSSEDGRLKELQQQLTLKQRDLRNVASSNESLAAKLAQLPRTPNEKLVYPSHLQTVISHLGVDKRDLERRICAAKRLLEEESQQREQLLRERTEAVAEAAAARKRYEEVLQGHQVRVEAKSVFDENRRISKGLLRELDVQPPLRDLLVRARCQVSKSKEGLRSIDKKQAYSRTTKASPSRVLPMPTRVAQPSLKEKLKL